MHVERVSVPAEAAEAIRNAKERGGRIIAVGTTVVRTLEHVVRSCGTVCTFEGETDLFILPGDQIRSVDALITNFHLPRSTLLMLVCAFAGTGLVLRAYAEAVASRYRFFSFGDAMLVL
jgi:S-adenosylmethionine:tRNA ribosyltransferase-isomerase